jgi:very-short-patch-repair endonuclease
MDARAPTRHLAKTFRRQLSLPEGLLWRRLKARGLAGLHFRKQHPLGPYVLDFYCETARLCVEIDGASHSVDDRPERDERRDAWLAGQEIRTLRLRAAYVLDDIDGTLRMILDAANGLDPMR